MKSHPVDFVSFSYYNSSCAAEDTSNLNITSGNTINAIKNPYLKASDWVGRLILRAANIYGDLYDRYRKPLFIVENGLGAADVVNEDGTIDDQYRIDYLREHMKAILDAIEEDGVDCLG